MKLVKLSLLVCALSVLHTNFTMPDFILNETLNNKQLIRSSDGTSTDPYFVIVIPSYNNINFYQKNIDFALNQTYKQFHIIFIDDCSDDATGEAVIARIKEHDKESLVTVIQNSERVGALQNIYNAVHMCDPHSIIVLLDGDDHFPHSNVLKYVADIYRNPDTWMTYGQYMFGPPFRRGHCKQIPDEVIAANSFREDPYWYSSHLRTFYAELFHQIQVEDFRHNDGKFFSMAWDVALMLPMLEMAGTHSKFISEILYIYNLDNPISDHAIDRSYQLNLDIMIRKKTKYHPLQELFMEESY